MSAGGLQARLRQGLDPNGSFAAVLGYAENWREAKGTGAVWNPRRAGLELTPKARPEIAQDWLPLAAIEGPDGTLYKSDTEGSRVLRRAPCDPDFISLPGFGGFGVASGKFHAPAGLALDSAGRLYVADTGNSRVQVLDLARESVVATLTEGLVLPVHVTVDGDGTIYVVDAKTGLVHVFSRRFQSCSVLRLATLDPATGKRWGAGPAPRPLAITILDDGTLAVFDPMRPMLWHMTRKGKSLAALGWFEEDDLPEGWSPIGRRFGAEADLVVGPIDGGRYDLAWHEVEIDADLPAGTALEVQTYASNGETDRLRGWAPARPLAAKAPETRTQRLVLADEVLWAFWRMGRTIRYRPAIAQLNGTGPAGTDRMTLPAMAARQLRPGDTLRLRIDEQDDGVLMTVASVADATWTAAATGGAAAFAAPSGLRLIQRDGKPLPYGPVDFGFLGEPGPPLAVTMRDGRPAEVPFPAALAGVIAPGDVLELQQDGAAAGRLELIKPSADPLEIRLTEAVAGDYSTCIVQLETTPGRLVLREDVPATGPLPPHATLALIADGTPEQVVPVWSDRETRTLWLSEMPPDMDGGRTFAEHWTNAQFPEPDPTDRGQYIWLRLRMTGRGLPPPSRIGPPATATASPLLRRIRIVAPRYSLLGLLPPLYAKHDLSAEPPGANFLERFLTLFEGHMTEAEAAFDSISRLLNPRAADAEWLAFIARWIDLSFDPSWPIERRRQLVIEGAKIQAGRGTPGSLRRYLEIYTWNAVGISEDYRTRPPEPIQLGARGALGFAPLGDEGLAGALAHRFRVTVTLPAYTDRRTEVSAIRGIIDSVRPAHTTYTLDTGGARPPRIGMGSRIGSIIIPGPGRAPPCTCDPDAPASGRPQPGNLAGGGFRLGGRLGAGPISDFRPQGG